MNAAIARLLADFVDAVNRGDQQRALAFLSPDVTIVEDLAPYRWQGPRAGAEWMRAMWENAQAKGIRQVHMQAGDPTRVETDGEGAYAIVPGILSYVGETETLRASGVLTFALVRTGDEWRISALAWSGPEATPG